MDGKAKHVAAILTSVAGYGGQLAAVFHNYALTAEKIPPGFEGAVNILDATVAVLKQVLKLAKDDAEGKKLFSVKGLTYVQALAQESAKTMAKVEPIIAEACLHRDEREAKRKQSKKTKKVLTEMDPISLKIDEKDFFDKVEAAKWSLAKNAIDNCMERLYDLQLHLLLVSEVVKVGAFWKELTSGRVDMLTILNFRDRINRTAVLVGIKTPRANKRSSFSSSSSDSSNESSDSDNSSIAPRRTIKPSPIKPLICGPPPPPPACFGPGARPPPPAPSFPCSPPAVLQGFDSTNVIIGNSQNAYNINRPNPPSYSENSPVKPLLPNPSLSTGNPVIPEPTRKATQLLVYPDEKLKLKEEMSKSAGDGKPAVPERRLFKSSNSLRFKFKSLFRSKESLAAEMKRVLINSECQLVAFLIQRNEVRQIPHSAFHTLEATHMKTILTQLNSREWYTTFSKLDHYEHVSMNRLLYPNPNSPYEKMAERELLVLKVLEKKRFNTWMFTFCEIFKNTTFPYLGNGRVLLAIVREKIVDGKQFVGLSRHVAPPPPPPPGPPRPALQAPPTHMPPPFKQSRISDLKYPAPPPGWPAGPPPPAPPPPRAPATPRVIDLSPETDGDAREVLTSYNEYTLRTADPAPSPSSPNPPAPRSWVFASVTQESNPHHAILARVSAFEQKGRNIIEMKLRLSEDQNAQMTRLMEDLRRGERDSRFEWTWVEISFYRGGLEVTDEILGGPGVEANVMHLIARRTLKPNFKASEVYQALMRPPPGPPPGGPPRFPPPPQPPVIFMPTPSPPVKKRYDSNDSDSVTTSICPTCRSDSDSSVGNVRRRLRKGKVRRNARRRICVDSDNSDVEDEEDVIKVVVCLKRGDDVMNVLLDLWTPAGEGKGKEKEKAKEIVI